MPETKDSVVQAGRDIKVGNVSGQVAIGSGINQYRDCTFVLTDGSVKVEQIWSYTQGIKPSTDPNSIFGRQQELQEIDELFKDNHAIAITGLEGVGKSTLASKYAEQLETRGQYKGIYWRKMDDSTEIADVIGSFFAVIGKPLTGQYKTADQLSLFFKELNSAPYFLVLDNFQMVMDPKKAGQLKSGFSDLIDKATELAGSSRFLFTCWQCPVCERGTKPRCYKIGGLQDEEAVKLLKKRGVNGSDDDLRLAVDRSDGNPLALILLAQLVIDDNGMSLQKAVADDSLWEDDVEKNILNIIYNGLLEEGEGKFLQYLSLFREPMPIEAVVAVANDPSWTRSKAEKIAFYLYSRKSVLNKSKENYWEESLIRRYAYDKLADSAYRHKLAYQYYLSLPLPEKHTKKEDIQPIIEAYYHACKAQEYDKAVELLFGNSLCEELEKWGNDWTLIDLYTTLLPKDHLGGEPLLKDLKNHGMVLGNLGIAHRNLSNVTKAITYYTKALKIARQVGDKQNEDKWLGHLGIAYGDLGNDLVGIEYFKKALEIAQQNRAQEKIYKKYECRWLADLGVSYYYLGNYLNSIRYSNEALKIAQSCGFKEYEGRWLGNIGCAYSDLYDYDKAIDYFNKALKIAQDEKSRRDECIWLGFLGYVYSNLGRYNEAIDVEERSLKIAEEIGNKQRECEALGCLGIIQYNLGHHEQAINYYKKAVAIAQQISDKRNEGVWLYKLSLVFSSDNKCQEAIACYLMAKQSNLRLGDPQEIAETENKIKDVEVKLGEIEFNKLLEDVAPRAEEIVQKILQETKANDGAG